MGLTKWPSTYVVLRNGCVYIYDSETASSTCHSTSLYGFSQVCECDNDEVPSSAADVVWPFKLVSELSLKNNVFYFSTATSAERQKWIEHLQQQIVYANGETNISPTCKPTSPLQQQQLPGFTATKATVLSSAAESCRSSSSPTLQPPQRQRPKVITPPKPRKPLPETTDEESDDDYEKIRETDEPESNMTDNFKCVKLADSTKIQQRQSATPSQPSTSQQQQPTDVERSSTANQRTDLKEKVPKPIPPKPPKKPQPAQRTNISISRQGDSVDDDGECDYVSDDDYKKYPAPPPPSNPSDETLVNQAYWRGNSSEGESIMKSMKVDGTYMIRESSNDPGTETLMVRNGHAILRYHITKTNDGKYCLGLQ
jgi:hypothetical protein